MTKVLILGCAPYAIEAAGWPVGLFDHVVAIHDAWSIREDWTHMIHRRDFSVDRRPVLLEGDQKVITEAEFSPVQTLYGGAPFTGGGMAFVAGYWVLASLAPSRIYYFACDMVELGGGRLYEGQDGPGEMRPAQRGGENLTAKARRLEYFAAQAGCGIGNLSPYRSALPYQRVTLEGLDRLRPASVSPRDAEPARQRERRWDAPAAVGTAVPAPDMTDIDAAWIRCFAPRVAAVA
ncbi:hypothetical protein MHM88_13350 [Epibacterium sp. MM17-32]|uniref:hypothetical protein n=1 Tax=Epibacterium sp. MM17-32 TaxID=2917734 RepID=UPI001EF6FE44|nr:hypothetical protein [Epibacterium sp. MM17-32]MCG7628789.1 hypothetical protein [Epibacterium sp. MM17-32]